MTTESASKRQRPLHLRIHTWIRWLHTYLSMLAFMVLLFFGATGITLNHPSWTFGIKESHSEAKGTVPLSAISGKEIDWLTIAETIRKQSTVKGLVDDRQSDDRQVSMTFKAPGYTADCFIDRPTGGYTLNIVSSGWLESLNDFHRGKSVGRAWSWVIDLSGGSLLLISLTGFGMMFYLKKIKVKGIAVAGVGLVVVLVLLWLASH